MVFLKGNLTCIYQILSNKHQFSSQIVYNGILY